MSPSSKHVPQSRLHLDNDRGVLSFLQILKIDLVILLLEHNRVPPTHHPQLPPKLLHPDLRHRLPSSTHPLPDLCRSSALGIPLGPRLGERGAEDVEFGEEEDVQPGHLVAEEGWVEEGELRVEEGEEGGVEGEGGGGEEGGGREEEGGGAAEEGEVGFVRGEGGEVVKEGEEGEGELELGEELFDVWREG